MANLANITSNQITLSSSSGEEIFNTNNKYLYENSNSPFWFIQGGESIAMDIDSQMYTGLGGGGRFTMKTNYNGTYTSILFTTYSYNSTWYLNNYNKTSDSTGVYCYYKQFGVL